MRRSLEAYTKMNPGAVVDGSKNQTLYFICDAQLDIIALGSLVQRVANLNPDAGEIGPGMLASLVTDARRILNVKG